MVQRKSIARGNAVKYALRSAKIKSQENLHKTFLSTQMPLNLKSSDSKATETQEHHETRNAVAHLSPETNKYG